MNFVRGLHNLTQPHIQEAIKQGCVATIGNFDGLHLGHQAVLRQVQKKAAEMALPSVVIIFEPQPKEFFLKEKSPARLMRLREKVSALGQYSIDMVLCLAFNEKLRSLSGESFVEQVLIKGLGIKYLAVGDDFRFGCDRKGDFSLLTQMGKKEGFSVTDTDTHMKEGTRISSTLIRDALIRGDCDEAKQLLGKPYSITGRVAYGRQLGRTIGYPTANIPLLRHHAAPQGVFAVEVSGPGLAQSKDQKIPGVANLGKRPTVDGETAVLEIHLFDFNKDIYNQYLSVDFLMKIRDEKKFDGIDALKQQIHKDAEQARQFFKL